MHFKRLKKRLNFVKAWKRFLKKQKQKQVELWAQCAQYNLNTVSN